MGRVNNKEKYKEYDHNYYVKHKRPKSKIGQAELKIADLEAKLAEKENEIKTLICDYESRITKTHELMSWLEHENEELKQQLEEKDKEINQLKQEKKNAGEEKARAYLDTLTKPKIIELCLQYINDKNIAEQQLEALMLEISKQEVEQHDLPDYCTRTGTDCTNLGKIEELQQQLAEKDKEIEMLNTIKNNAIECADLFKVALSVRQKDLAIHELEKVKEWLEPKYFDYEQINYLTRIIDQQIKELKGENK